MRRLVLLTLLLAACGDEEASTPTAPTDPVALHAWLSAGEYSEWRSESAPLPALNGTRRRVFLGPSVVPEGSAVGASAVREIWDADGVEQLGWSVLVKTERGWWFYETFDFDDDGAHAVAEHDAPGCVGCHGQAPDIIRSSTPLR